jgi:hypothetical protein
MEGRRVVVRLKIITVLHRIVRLLQLKFLDITVSIAHPVIWEQLSSGPSPDTADPSLFSSIFASAKLDTAARPYSPSSASARPPRRRVAAIRKLSVVPKCC